MVGFSHPRVRMGDPAISDQVLTRPTHDLAAVPGPTATRARAQMMSITPVQKSLRPARRIARRSASPDQPFHLHIENTSSLGDVFEVTRKRLREALARHPNLAD